MNLQTRGILYLQEAGIRSAKSSTSLLGFNNYSLEHMMPKKWRNNWAACATDILMEMTAITAVRVMLSNLLHTLNCHFPELSVVVIVI